MSTEQWWVRAGISWAEPSRPELKRRGAGAFQFSSWNWAVNFLWHITFLAENFFFLAFTNFCISHFLKRKCVIHYKKELKCKVFWKSEWQKVPNLLFSSWNKIFELKEKKVTSRAGRKILQLELLLEPAQYVEPDLNKKSYSSPRTRLVL